MFKKKDTKTLQSAKAQTKKPAVKSGKAQTSKAAAKKGKTQPGKTAAKGGKQAAQGKATQDRSDAVLAKLMAIEKETRLKEARDQVDQLDDENIAANIEQLLKIIGSGE